MAMDVYSPKQTIKPRIYVRIPMVEQYVSQLREFAADVIVEPWKPGTPEPEPQADISDCDVIITVCLRDTLQILDKAPRVRWVHSLSVGIDAVQTDRLNPSVVITNPKGCTSIPIAEHTVMCITAFARNFPTMQRNQAQKKWQNVEMKELLGSTVGILGYGEIGGQIAQRCKALGMRVIGCRRNPAAARASDDAADLVVGLDQVDMILAESDFLVLALPSSEGTYHFLNREKLVKMKAGSYLINVGRGNTVHDGDLIAALQSGHLAGAALDVFEVEPLPVDHPYWEMENVIVTPHNAYYSPRTLERNMELLRQNLIRYVRGEELLNVVNVRAGY